MMKRWMWLAAVLVSLAGVAAAQETYQVPPKELVEIADAPAPLSVFAGPGDWVLVARPTALLTIADLSQPELRLGGYRFNPVTHDQMRAQYAVEMSLLNAATGEKRAITGLPSPLRARNATWSPDGSRVAFTIGTETGVTLWTADLASGRAARAGNVLLNGTHPRRPYEWLDNRTLLVRAVPSKRPAPPEPARVPAGPLVQENLGRRTPSRTWQDLLQNEHDADLFEYHLQSQLVAVSLDGSARNVGAPGMIVRAEPSPDGAYLLVETVKRPFSYIVAEGRFPRRFDIWSRDGKPVRTVAELPLMDTVIPDRDAAAEGPRNLSWRADTPATLYWVEAQDKGNPRVEAAVRDKVLMLAAPFSGAPVELASLATRFGGMAWGNGDVALINERWWKTRRIKSWRIRPSQPGAAPELLFDRSAEDRYNAPGTPVTRSDARGMKVLRLANGGTAFYLIGEGASPEGDRPFVDRFDLVEKKATRLWRSEGQQYELPIAMLDDEGRRLLTRRETPTEPPNLFLRDLGANTTRALTNVAHPMPQIAAAKKELLRYERADGVKLTATLYTPPGYDPARDGRLPVLMWAYPEEFLSEDAAGQVTTSPHRFIRASISGALPFLLRGYAVLDDPSIPIVAQNGGQPNDTYIEQLIAGATAAVEEVVRRGVGDRDRIAVGGHSYGAFMTTNLLAHTNLFRAGIARSGAYNRSLTPFTFQNEDRNFWEAPEAYNRMSPFMHAQKIDEPLLLIHGAADDNPGSFPIQSERLFQALKGLGGTARLVMLPQEAHGYRARESVLHMLWEMDRWLETYVKKAKPREAKQ